MDFTVKPSDEPGLPGLYTVVVGMGFRNPDYIFPALRVDVDYVAVMVEATNDTEAQLIACQMASCHCDMPTSSYIEKVIL